MQCNTVIIRAVITEVVCRYFRSLEVRIKLITFTSGNVHHENCVCVPVCEYIIISSITILNFDDLGP